MTCSPPCVSPHHFQRTATTQFHEAAVKWHNFLLGLDLQVLFLGCVIIKLCQGGIHSFYSDVC